MSRFASAVSCLLVCAASAHAARLRVENDTQQTASLQSPGDFAVTLTIVSVTETADGLEGVGWFGGSGLDVTHSVMGSAVVDIDPADITVVGSNFTDVSFNFSGMDTTNGVRNILFATNLEMPGPGSVADARVSIARVNVRVTGAVNGDMITISIADTNPPPEAFSNANISGFFISSRTAHTISVTSQRSADFDGDGDVDLADYMEQQRCFAGPGVAVAPDCTDADLDGDGDVDLADVIALQGALTGSK